MHKEIPVVDLYLDKSTGQITYVGALQEVSHLPIGTTNKAGVLDEKALKE